MMHAQIDSASVYLRHELYNELEEEHDSVFRNAKYALGSEDTKNTTVAIDVTSKFMLVLTIEGGLKHLSRQLVAFIRSTTNDSSISNELLEEQQSMEKLASISYKELLHYAKHTIRGYWQEKEEDKIKRSLDDDTLLLGLDHKSKTCTMQKFESMSMYFGKNGMFHVLLLLCLSWNLTLTFFFILSLLLLYPL